jgi:hypothetical protein
MNTIRHSRRLRQKIEQVLPELSTATTAVVMHPQFRELYAEFLVTVHQMIRASVPLMRTALRRCLGLREDDPVAACMVPYLEQHIKEELHHDDWLLEDLELIHMPRQAVLGRMPSSAVASMIGAHYYWIHHHHPVAQLGQMAAMEGYPAGVEVIDMMAERSGYPRQAFRTLEKHCHLDPNHRDDFIRALDRMPLQEEHHAILEISALHTVRMAVKAYREVVARASVPPRRSGLKAMRIGENGHYRLEALDLGRTYQIGKQEHFLLSLCDGQRSPDEVCKAFGDRFGQSLTRPELNEFLEMARAEHLFAEDGT